MRRHRWLGIVLLLLMGGLMLTPPSVVRELYCHGSALLAPAPEVREPAITPGEGISWLGTGDGVLAVALVALGAVLVAGFAALVTREHRRSEDPVGSGDEAAS